MTFNARKIILSIAAGVALCSLVFGMVATGGAQSMRAPRDKARSIGPGKVRLSLTSTGAWQELHTAWDDEGSLIDGGGFVMFAEGPGGVPVEIGNTSRGDVRATARVEFRKCVEGNAGGFRAPSPRPDDDGDGRVDEDRLDGIDNDGDGRVDEDFAAIGDEMIVTGFHATVGSGVSIEFHQEMYGWSLPHIDGAIMIRLDIRNTGTVPVENVRVGMFYDRPGDFGVHRQKVSSAGGHDAVTTEAIVTGSVAGTQLAVVPFPQSDPDARWKSGYVTDGADRFEAIMSSLHRPTMVDGYVKEGATIYSMSPAIERLAPGAHVEVNLAIVVAPPPIGIAEVATSALQTYLGDGDNRYLPPPVAMKPRVLWGHYRPLPDDNGALWVDFDVVGQAPVEADAFSFFSGVDAAGVGVEEMSPGHSVLVLRKEFAEKLKGKSDRVTLKGRLDSGEFFEAILRPYSDTAREAIRAEAAESFWSTQGKLTGQLVKGSPNPFRESTRITYEIPSSIEQDGGSVLYFDGSYETSVKVYNVAGRLVSVLVDQYQGPGTYSLNWSAIDDHGSPVASGVYYVKLQIEKRFVTERLILLK
jgi:hypothetical protein